MKVTPQTTVDFEEYPELKILADQAIRRVVELMEIHDIASIRRYRKTGVFEHPYVKDTVIKIGVPSVPSTVAAARDNVGSALLDYLEAVGLKGLSLELTREDVVAINSFWSPPEQQPVRRSEPKQPSKSLDPQEVGETNPAEPDQKPAEPDADPTPEAKPADVPPPAAPAVKPQPQRKPGAEAESPSSTPNKDNEHGQAKD